MQNSIFLISLLLFSLIPASYQVQLSTNMTPSQIINYDLSQIHDCSSLSTFQDELQATLEEHYVKYEQLASANAAVNWARDNIAVMIDTSSFFMKSQNKINKNQLKAKKKFSLKKTLESNKDKLHNYLNFLGDIYGYASEDCKKKINALSQFLSVQDFEKQNIVDICNQVIWSLEDIGRFFENDFNEIGGIINNLSSKFGETYEMPLVC